MHLSICLAILAVLFLNYVSGDGGIPGCAIEENGECYLFIHDSCRLLEPFYITALGVAQLRVGQAIMFIEDILANNNPNQHYAAVLKLLLDDDEAEIEEALERLKRIRDHLVLVPLPDQGPQEIPAVGDAVLFCDNRHLRPHSEDDDTVVDTVTGMSISTRSSVVNQCFDPYAGDNADGDAYVDLALTMNFRRPTFGNMGWYPQDHAEAIYVCSWYINMCSRWGYLLTDENVADVRRTVATQMQYMLGMTQVDSLRTLEFVLNHEIMHLSMAGIALDPDVDGGCYGWLQCVEEEACKTAENAETLAFLGLAAELIAHRGLTVTVDGLLVPF